MSQPCRGRVLMVAYGFPPTGGGGVQRSVKFAKYLPQSGWLPTVWAADPIAGLPEDHTLLADLTPEVAVHRWSCERGVRSLGRFARSKIGRGRVATKLVQAVDWRLDAWLTRGPYTDEYASWARASIRPLRRLIHKEPVDAIYSTFSPVANHLLALALKRETGQPWVADFRDLWTDDPRYHEPSRRRRLAHRRLEQEILETADAVIGVTPRQTEILAGHVPTMRHKFVTITNGFDPVDFVDVGRDGHRLNPAFVLAFVGRFDHFRANEVLLSGLRRFVSELGANRDRFVLRIVGHADESTLARIHSAGIRYVFTGYVPHREAVREMAEADALLASVKPDGLHANSIINGKLFEYLASQRPILIVGPEGGEGARIVCSCGAGLTANTDEESVAAALRKLYDAWQTGHPMNGCHAAHLPQYSRLESARRLAEVFDRLVVSKDTRMKDEG
ncbi:MAG: glycosyltransferase [Phycisphaerae bacterium]